MKSGRQQVGLIVCAPCAAAIFLWSYAPTLRSLWQIWQSEPDYSHGILVVPIAASFLWFRRFERPEIVARLSWPAILLLAGTALLRFFGRRWNFEFLDCWSLIAWTSGAIWLTGGKAMLHWCLPSIGFLFFMMPLPFRIEQSMSMPLQTVATHASCWMLQSLGQCALAEGNTILLGSERLEIEQACAGLRVLFGSLAMAVAYAVLAPHSWWERALIILCAIPVALLANVARIVSTGLAKQHAPGGWVANWSHDFGGHLMTAVAVVLFAVITWYWNRLFGVTPEPNFDVRSGPL